MDTTDRQKLEKAGTLHWFHWMIVALSIFLTFAAWYFSKNQLREKQAIRFEREADQMVELILERMRKYEDALWGGVALIHTLGGDVDYDQWSLYAQSIHIEKKYPGINGIGVIHALMEDELPAYLAHQRIRRPDYHIHPEHDGNEYYPITYIEPLMGNEKAVGLDIAHEVNRFTAAKKARDTGDVQITGPIVLVQDAKKTPGFLFYAPFYRAGVYESVKERRANFIGMVYAPFVIQKLMEGVLAKQKRQVGIRMADGADVLYDEHLVLEDDFDPTPLFKKHIEVGLYGQNWQFDLWSTKSFRASVADSQPTIILMGGIFIDCLLFFLFVLISRANRNALAYADRMNEELQVEKSLLENSNQELEHFAYVASHDLQEPLRMVSSFLQLLQRRYAEQLDDKANRYIAQAVDGSVRMKRLIHDLLSYSRVGVSLEFSTVDCNVVLRHVLETFDGAIENADALVTYDHLPTVMADEGQLGQVFQNLIGNAIKFQREERLQIHIGVEERASEWVFRIADNGIGIEQAYVERIFVIFQRLHPREAYPGTGIGLAICKKIVERHGGRIWLISEVGKGTTFYFSLPKR